MVPPLDSLVTTGLLPDPGRLQAGPAIDPGAEFTEIRRGLEGIITDVAVSHRPRFGLGAGSWRFNRVEGLSAGAAMTVPVTARVNAALMGRIGVADWQPRGEAWVGRRTDESSVHLAAYRRLADGSDFDDPLDLSSSVKALFTGNDRGTVLRCLRGGARPRLDQARAGRRPPGLRRGTPGRRGGDQLPPPQAVHQGKRRRQHRCGGGTASGDRRHLPVELGHRSRRSLGRGGRLAGRPRPVPSSTSAPPSRSGRVSPRWRTSRARLR